jgi:murein DD-endopeptidase MepM/ murein hydrolase activator NlpD
VDQATQLGLMGTNGNSDGEHLHCGVYYAKMEMENGLIDMLL